MFNVVSSIGLTLGGGLLAVRGLKNCCSGHSNVGKYQVAIGAISMVGGIWSLLNSGPTKEQIQYDRLKAEEQSIDYLPFCPSTTSRTDIVEACKDGLRYIFKFDMSPDPYGFDLSKHIDRVVAYDDHGPHCGVDLTSEGGKFAHNEGLIPHGVKKVIRFATSSCRFFTVIRNY